MRTVEQIVNDLKDAQTREEAARAVTLRYREELNQVYITVKEALGLKDRSVLDM